MDKSESTPVNHPNMLTSELSRQINIPMSDMSTPYSATML
jgi:hypothetical protein